MRIALGLEYNGAAFHGFQSQIGLRTVQGCLEKALSEVADHPVNLVAAGRTDTGVHASHQVIHFDTHAQRSERAWVFGTNANLPFDITIKWAQWVSDEFHARFSAIARAYRYLIYNHSVRSSLFSQGVTWHFRPLDAQKMHEAAQYLQGEHDFTSYRALGCQARSPVRTISHISVRRQGPLVILDVKGNGFLHHMVRNIAGVLMAIGAEQYQPEWANEVLMAQDRCLGGVTAPPYGLYLTAVDYPAHFALPQEDSLFDHLLV